MTTEIGALASSTDTASARHDHPPRTVYDDDRLTAIGLFFEVHHGLAATLEERVQAQAGVAPQLFEILLRLARSPEQSLRMTDLAAQVALSPSGLTRAVDRLVAAGLVRRDACPTDRRVAYAALTDEGRERLDAALPAHLADVEELFTGVLDPDELARFTATLRTLRARVHPGATQVTGRPRAEP